jgi:hypothetical protein
MAQERSIPTWFAAGARPLFGRLWGGALVLVTAPLLWFNLTQAKGPNPSQVVVATILCVLYGAALACLVALSCTVAHRALVGGVLQAKPAVEPSVARSIGEHLRAELREGAALTRWAAMRAFVFGWAGTLLLALLTCSWQLHSKVGDLVLELSQLPAYAVVLAGVGGVVVALVGAIVSLLWRLAGPWLWTWLLVGVGGGAMATWLSYERIFDFVVAALLPKGGGSGGGGGPGFALIAVLWLLVVFLLTALLCLLVFALIAALGFLLTSPLLVLGIVTRFRPRARLRDGGSTA